MQDHHSYFVFSPSNEQESGTQLTVDVDGAIADSLLDVAAKQRRNLVIDEWSCALTPSSLGKEKNVHDVQKKFCQEQIKVYRNATAGWAFWCKYLSLPFKSEMLAEIFCEQHIRKKIATTTLDGALKLLLEKHFRRVSFPTAK